jgi:hypothetical protein
MAYSIGTLIVSREAFLKAASKSFHINRIEFEQYKRDNAKLAACKALKVYLDIGLKESKEAIDLYWEGNLQNIQAERKEKLEKLAKRPLVDELIVKLKNDDYILSIILMKMTIDELMDIDEQINEKLIK